MGEAPGRDEDRVGKPFVGRAGLLLDDIFTYAGFDMDRHVYITNVAKRRPPENRTPTPEEVDYYLPLLMEEIRLVDPAIIILAGATPLRAILNLSGISKVRGQKFAVEYAGRARDVMPIFHPAYLLRNAIKKHEMKVCLVQLFAFLVSPLVYSFAILLSNISFPDLTMFLTSCSINSSLRFFLYEVVLFLTG